MRTEEKYSFLPLALAMALGCGGTTARDRDAGSGADADADTDTDTGVDTDSESTSDSDTGTDTEAPAGELVIEQIYFPQAALAEAILVIGPDGTSALIDAANDGQTAEILEAVERRTGGREIDWLIVTHYHSDHIGGIDNLLTPSAANGGDPLEVARGVVTRGLVDLDADTASASDFVELCDILADDAWADRRYDLCSPSAEMPCGDTSGAPWAASACDGLLSGDLGDPADDGAGATTFIPLGGGARLYLYQADAHAAAGGVVAGAEADGLDVGYGGTEPENARSLGGAVRFGDFTWTFNGDTTSAEPAMEAWIAARGSEIALSPGGFALIPEGDADVVHLGHHGLDSATGQAWVDWLLPNDGRDRNAEIGNTSLYYRSPAQEVLDRVGPRLGDGFVWANTLGILPGSHARLVAAEGALVIRAVDGGSSYAVSVWKDGEESGALTFESTAP